jgi:flagellar motor switch protein FliG
VEAAQQEVIVTLRRLEAEGVLSLASGPAERYVV